MGKMQGKTVIITGANTGIGKATAIELAKDGARVLITARNPAKGETAVSEIKQAAGSETVELFLADYSKLDDVRRLSHELDAATDRIDVLIHNAGLILSERTLTSDGHETTFQVNHLASFLLTGRLLEKLKMSKARVINTSSGAHQAAGGLDFDDLMSEHSYKGFKTYARSKLCNLLFSQELARQLEGSGATSNALHPGVVNTQFAGDGDTKGWFTAVVGLFRPFYRTPLQGAATTIFLARADEVNGVSGKYFVDKKPKSPTKAGRDEQAAKRLWEVSERLVA